MYVDSMILTVITGQVAISTVFCRFKVVEDVYKRELIGTKYVLWCHVL